MMPDLTRNQKLVYDALTEAGQPQSAYALLARVKAGGMRAPLQVYRALEALMAYGMVHRVESLNAFIACSHPRQNSCTATVIAVCSACNVALEAHDERIEQHLLRWSSERAFRCEKMTVEIKGTCSSCSVKG